MDQELDIGEQHRLQGNRPRALSAFKRAFQVSSKTFKA
jgi:hypothetical protein